MGMKKKEINYQLLIRRICLIVLDIICIIAASILALLTRFEFDFSQIPKEFLKVIYKYGPFTIVITLIIFSLFRIYSSLWEYAGIEEVFSLIAACLAAAVAKIVIILFTWSVMPRSWYVLDTIYLMILIGATRVSYRLIRLRRQNRTFPWSNRKKVMIIGGGEAGRSLITEIQNSKYLDQKVVCIIDDDPYKIGRYIKGVKVVGNRNSIKKSVKKYNVQQIILTIPSANAAKIRPIVEICQDTNCELMILPGVYQLVNGEVKASKLRPVNIDDLLGRDEVHVNLNEVMDYVSGRVIMVTGGGGSIGSELCRQIAKHSPKQLIIFDIYENNAYDIQQELLREQPKLDLVVLIGSVRDENRINSIFEQYRPEIIYHAAAHKHVPLMEGSPNEAIKNNVLGTYNMVRMADKWNAKRFVQISTDKAVNPTNIMGASKRICEMIIQTYNKESNTEYVAVRFGNVLGSNGSVIPLFKKQIAEGGPVTVTHPEIIRYFMTIPEAVSLVLQAGAYAKGGEIFVLDMGEPVKILDLARNMIRLSGYKVDQDIKIEFTGLRPGEKLYEELLMDEEGMTDTPNKLIHIGHPIDVDEVKLLRDSLVDIDGHGKSRLGHTYAYGGVGLTINTINKTYDLDIQNYITISFDDLVNVIDEIGGVTVFISEEEAAYYRENGMPDIQAGDVTLTGSQALAHARNRTLGNDFERTRRQRSVMYGIYRKIMEKKDPSALLPLINYAVNHVRTNMSVSEMYSMAKDVLSVDDLKMQQTCIPQDGTYTDITYEGMQVLKVDFDANKKKIEQLLY